VLQATKVAIAGVVAGTLATAVQVLLWVTTGANALELLWQDTRLTAALVLGKSALSPDAAVDIPILLIAAGVYFSLSILFAALLAPAAGHWRPAASLAVGVSFGVLLYVVNLHILTALFPWFVAAHGGTILAAHVVFGVTAMITLRMRLPASN
jgi:hypothetical protein